MSYTEDQIKKYLEILHNYTKQPVEGEAVMVVSKKAKCCNCQNNECFTIDSGYKICDYCGAARVFIRESITMRKRLIRFLKD